MAITIRPETAADIPAIHKINTLAFGRAGEADLVDALRTACPEAISLVALTGLAIVGHILFTPVTIDNSGHPAAGFGLGPVAVHPDFQRQGIGSSLIREGLRQLDANGCPYIVVLGHRTYYPRFGFTPALPFGIRCKWDPSGEHFMIRFPDPAHPPSICGMVHYHAVFDTVT